jgi:hypothetical protein
VRNLDSAELAGIGLPQAGLKKLFIAAGRRKNSDFSLMFIANCFGFGKNSETFISFSGRKGRAVRTCPHAIMDISVSGFVKEFHFYKRPTVHTREGSFRHEEPQRIQET